MNKGTKRNLGLRLPLRLMLDATKEQMNSYRVLREMTVKKFVYKEVVCHAWLTPALQRKKNPRNPLETGKWELKQHKHISSCLVLRRQNLKLTPAQSEGLGYC